MAKIDAEVILMLADEWIRYGDICYYQMRFEEALVAYDQSLRSISEYPPALLGKARTLMECDRQEEAKRYIDSILFQNIQTQPQQKGKAFVSSKSKYLDLIHAYCKGKALLLLGKLQEASTTFHELQQRIPTSEENLLLDIIPRKLYAEALCGEGDALLLQGHLTSHFRDFYEQAITTYSEQKK